MVGAGSSVSVTGLPASVDISNAEPTDQLVINALDGNDTINAGMLPATTIKLTIDGGAGNDTILGGTGADVLRGGDGNDFVHGNQGNDVAFLGAGDDTFQWNPGDGSDTVEGEDGTDRMLFNGSAASEAMDLFANGTRAGLFRDVANILMDTNGVERIDVNALGGADAFAVGDMSGTSVVNLNIDLAGAIGGTTGDGQIDTMTVNGTQGDDTSVVTGSNGAFNISGLPVQVNATHVEGANDKLVISALGGADVIDATGLAAGVVQLEMLGGLGVDTFLGSAGDDLIVGGDGNDVAFMGAGDDTFAWSPGDDDDTLEGQDGFDTMRFNGANVSEQINVFANGGRVLFTRDIANVTMDSNDLESINYAALGGADTITVNDLNGTDVTEVNINLAGTIGGTTGDAQADTVVATGTAGDDVVLVAGNATSVSALGLPAQVNVANGEVLNDRLVIRAGAGADVVDASAVSAGSMRLVLEGGDGDDILIGSAGDDILDGGAGEDVLIGGGGNDTFLNGEITIQNFQAGKGSEDRIDLRNIDKLSFDWLVSHATMVNGNAVLDLGNGEHLTLLGINIASLHQHDFMLGGG